MRANCWLGKGNVDVLDVPEPRIMNDHDAIVRITSTAICGSDLHLFNGFVPTMKKGDILGHEFMGEVVEVGREVRNLTVGDRVVVPFPIACGQCNACREGVYSVCENSNPNAGLAEKILGHAPAGIFGYSHMLGGYPSWTERSPLRSNAAGSCWPPPSPVTRKPPASCSSFSPWARTAAACSWPRWRRACPVILSSARSRLIPCSRRTSCPRCGPRTPPNEHWPRAARQTSVT